MNHARASIVWILALLVAFGSVWWIERQTGLPLVDAAEARAPRALTADETSRARAAWAWFEQHPQPASDWEARYTLVAVVAARQLGLVDPNAADLRLQRAAQSLGGLQQAAGSIPADAPGGSPAAANAAILESLALIQRGTAPKPSSPSP